MLRAKSAVEAEPERAPDAIASVAAPAVFAAGFGVSGGRLGGPPSSPAAVLALQRAVGNRAVAGLLSGGVAGAGVQRTVSPGSGCVCGCAGAAATQAGHAAGAGIVEAGVLAVSECAAASASSVPLGGDVASRPRRPAASPDIQARAEVAQGDRALAAQQDLALQRPVADHARIALRGRTGRPLQPAETGSGLDDPAHELAHPVQRAAAPPATIRRQVMRDAGVGTPDAGASPPGGAPAVSADASAPAAPGDLPVPDPCGLAVRPLTNAKLLATFTRVDGWRTSHRRSDDGYNDVVNLLRRLARERGRRINAGNIWMAEDGAASQGHLYQMEHSPGGPLEMQLTPVAPATVTGAFSDRSSAPVVTRRQFMRILEQNRLPPVDPQEYYHRQQAIVPSGQAPQPLTVQMPEPEPPPQIVDLTGLGRPDFGLPGLGRPDFGLSPSLPMTTAGDVGFGPIPFSPTPTSADSLDAFVRQLWDNRSAVRAGTREAYSFYSRRDQALPTPDAADYRTRAMQMGPTDLQFGNRIIPIADVEPGRTGEGFYHYSPRGAEIRYRVYVNAAPDHALDVMEVILSEIVRVPDSGVNASKVAAVPGVGHRRDNILVTADSQATLDRVLLRLHRLHSEHPRWLLSEAVPMTDPILPGIGVAVEPPSHASFGAARTDPMQEILMDPAVMDFETFRARVRQSLLDPVQPTDPNAPPVPAVQPGAPHADRTLQTMSLEHRAWLQAGGSTLGAHHLGGLRSPAMMSTAAGAGMGVVMIGGHMLLSPDRHPHALRDLSVGVPLAAAGGYGTGAIEMGLNARWSPTEFTRWNSTFGAAGRGMILPRMGAGAVGGGVMAPLTTWAGMGIDQMFFDGDYTGIDYAALGARSAVSGAAAGAAGAGAASLTVFVLGGAAAGSEVPIIGNIIGAGVGLFVYWVTDTAVGEDVEQGVRSGLGEGGCTDHPPPD